MDNNHTPPWCLSSLLGVLFTLKLTRRTLPSTLNLREINPQEMTMTKWNDLSNYVNQVTEEKRVIREFGDFLQALEVYDCAKGGDPYDYNYYAVSDLYTLYKHYVNSQPGVSKMPLREEIIQELEDRGYTVSPPEACIRVAFFKCDVIIPNLTNLIKQ